MTKRQAKNFNFFSSLVSFRSADVLGEGQSYQMLQLHFHWGADDSRGSEHTINGEEFPMEMHIVHKKVGLTVEEALATPDGLAVVGQMFEVALFLVSGIITRCSDQR